MFNNNLKTTLLIVLLAIQPTISFGKSTSKANIIPGNADLLANIYELVDHRKLDIEIFKRALNSEQSKLIIATLQGLGRIGGDAILPLIKPHFLSKQPEIRRAAVFAAGLSSSNSITKQLWLLLNNEKSEQVKQEIYLALGNLGDDDLVNKMLARLNQETDPKTRGSIFQGLAAAITYIESVSDQIGTDKNSTNVDFNALLTLFEKDDYVAFRVGYFLARVKNIENLLNPAQLQKFTTLTKDPDNKRMLARLIGRITKNPNLADRALLSWLIEQSESEDLALASESIFAMSNLLYIPQAKIQLGKLHIHNNPLIAQTALQVLADSSLDGVEIISLLKKQLKSPKASMVVAAMSGLVDRQKQDEMSWAVKILAHKNPFVKIRFAKKIAEKDLSGFKTVLGFLAKDPDPSVAKFATSLIDPTSVTVTSKKAKTPLFSLAKESIGKIILLRTSAGDIKLQITPQALYTGANFVRLVEKGYYNRTYFSRMLGNFVAQGGDSVGDVEGGSGEMIREEISYQSHTKGTVGIATSGKDTGDAQIFVNISDNIHLDRHYSTFAKVIEGMEVVHTLSNGDQIIEAKLVD